MRDAAPDFSPLIPEVKWFFGIESLARTRRGKSPADLSFGPSARATDESADDSLAALRERQRLALTPQRAARLVARLLPKKSLSITTADFTATDLDEMLDLLAIAAYDQAVTADGHRLRWSINGPGKTAGLTPTTIPTDPHAGWNLEHFQIQRL